MHYRTVTTRVGLRLVQHGTILSEIRATPGPTQSVVDVIAAAVQGVSRGSAVALLGFAGGGLLAPLRAMGGGQKVFGVDLDASGWSFFRRLCSSWAGQVHFQQAEACTWLRTSKRCYDVIIDDLSAPRHGDVVKPAITWSGLPSLIYRRLTAQGVAIFNLLPPEACSWDAGVRRLVAEPRAARIVSFTDYENRCLIVSSRLPDARAFSRLLRESLNRIGSKLADRISVRTWAA